MENVILVTGGCGYIGSHTIIEIFRNTNWKVISVDNFLNSSADTLERIELVTGKKVLNYNVDLSVKGTLDEIFRSHPEITGVIHFAALKSVPDSVENPI